MLTAYAFEDSGVTRGIGCLLEASGFHVGATPYLGPDIRRRFLAEHGLLPRVDGLTAHTTARWSRRRVLLRLVERVYHPASVLDGGVDGWRGGFRPRACVDDAVGYRPCDALAQLAAYVASHQRVTEHTA